MSAELKSILERVAATQPQVHRLAMLASLAARIQAPLLRRLRLVLMPQAEPGIEADLWFSALIDTSDSDACLLFPWVANQLRLQLGSSGHLEEVWRLLEAAHTDAPASQRIEEHVAYLALRDGDFDPQIVAELRRALKAMVSGSQRGLQVARWALHALPRLPQRVAALPEATSLSRGMAARLVVPGSAPAWSDTALFKHAEDAWVLPRTTVGPGIEIGLRREPGGLRVRAAGDVPAGAVLTIPDSRLRCLQVCATDPAGRRRYAMLRGRPGEGVEFETAPSDIEITIETGEVFGFEPAVQAPAPTPRPASAPPPPPPTRSSGAARRRFEDCRYTAYISYAHADDVGWHDWVTCFNRELELTLPARLRGISVPKTHLSGKDGPLHGDLGDQLRARIDSSFVMILVVHDNYVQSGWWQLELDYFRRLQGDEGLRERLYIVAMSKDSIHQMMADEAWKRLTAGFELVWMPFFEADDPDTPIGIYSDRGIVANTFWTPFVRLREDLVRKIKASMDPQQRAIGPRPAGPIGEVVRVYVEVNPNETDRWEAISAQLASRWDAVTAAMGLTPSMYLRPSGLPMDSSDPFSYLDDADGVVLLFGTKSVEALSAQIRKIESRLPGPDVAPAMVASLSPPRPHGGAPASPAGNWAMVRFNATANAVEVEAADMARLDSFIGSVVARAMRRRQVRSSLPV